MGRVSTPPWEWVQIRLPDAERLTFHTDSCHIAHAGGVEQELVTAHLLLVLSHADTHKLRELAIFYPGREEHQCPERNGHVSKAISRFTLLTRLSLYGLKVEADTLQVSAQ